MVLLSAGICTKSGRAVLARQFVEMTRSRVEGLFAAFPKLLSESQQHTFVETDSVRYVYQPIEQLYMVLVTTKTSNILEDLETLHLFARVIPEYCRSLDERDISDNVFDLIFAFDEIVALGYRESVTIAQVRTFTEMDSHEEKVFQMVQKNKEKEAKEEMKRKMKEMESQRRAERKGRGGSKGYGGGTSTGFGSGSGMGQGQDPNQNAGPQRSGGFKGGAGATGMGSGGMGSGGAPTPSRSTGGGMKLGGKKDGDAFLGQLMAEGVNVGGSMAGGQGAPVNLSSAKRQPSLTGGIPQSQEAVHIKIEEKITLTALRDGGLEQMEVKGDLILRVADAEYSKIALKVLVPDPSAKPFQYKTHPNCNKQLFAEEGMIGLKNPGRGFPVGSEQGVLKYRCATTDDSLAPLTINCWPNVNPDGTCDVNIEYDLEDQALSLENVLIVIPMPNGKPDVGNVEGEANYNARDHTMEWNIPIIDASSPTGSMELSAPARQADDFFPIQCAFVSNTSFSGMEIEAVVGEGNSVTPFSTETTFSTDNFQVV